MRNPSELRELSDKLEDAAAFYDDSDLSLVAQQLMRVAHEVESRERGISNAMAMIDVVRASLEASEDTEVE